MATSPAETDLDFYPSAARVRLLDARMRAELANSLTDLLEQLQQLETASYARYAERIFPAIDHLRQSMQASPAAFAAYYRLVIALMNDDQSAEAYAEILRKRSTAHPALTIKPLAAEALGSQLLEDLYRGALDTDQHVKFGFLTPAPAASAATEAAIRAGLKLMQELAPKLAEEFGALVREIILAAPLAEPGSPQFDGSSSYQLWGALAMSVSEEKSALEMVETLAHESAHSLLFGMTIDDVLTDNPEDELYESPLREDRRPMDGIYHATYVSARMHYAMQEALSSGKLDPQQIHECRALLEQSARAFFDGYSVVADQGRLTATGKQVMAGALSYMRDIAGDQLSNQSA